MFGIVMEKTHGAVPFHFMLIYHKVELPDVYHSTNRPEDWYGSDKIIDQWLNVVLEQLKN
jgi:hypothetical protein